MTRVQHGRVGWRIKAAALMRGAMLLAACGGFVASGCSSAGKQAAGAPSETLPPTAGGGMGETTLKQFQSGALGAPGAGAGPLQDIHFAFNDYTIQPQDGAVLKHDADWLMAHPKTRVQAEGHCDERGSEDYNIALGAKRAQAAKDYLVTLGIPASRISTISYGKELPLCSEHAESCWARNRRDHFVVSE